MTNEYTLSPQSMGNINQISRLRDQFKAKWGKSIFDLPMPNIFNTDLNLTEFKDLMEILVDTGESLQEGYIKYVIKRPLTLEDVLRPVNTHNNYKSYRKEKR